MQGKLFWFANTMLNSLNSLVRLYSICDPIGYGTGEVGEIFKKIWWKKFLSLFRTTSDEQEWCVCVWNEESTSFNAISCSELQSFPRGEARSSYLDFFYSILYLNLLHSRSLWKFYHFRGMGFILENMKTQFFQYVVVTMFCVLTILVYLVILVYLKFIRNNHLTSQVISKNYSWLWVFRLRFYPLLYRSSRHPLTIIVIYIQGCSHSLFLLSFKGALRSPYCIRIKTANAERERLFTFPLSIRCCSVVLIWCYST